MTTRALVLGGGGPLGIAWETGLLAGLAAGGIDLSRAEFILGTSAGAFVGAQLAMGRSPRKLVEALLTRGKPGGAKSESSPDRTPAAVPDLAVLIAKMQEAVSGSRPAQEVRAEIAAWALNAQTITEDVFIASFGRWLKELPADAWPERRYACTAVDAADGSFVLWNQEAGVGLARAVASSCSVPGVFPPITIGGRRYIDGGMRSATNADLAKGYDVAVVVAITAIAPDPAMAERFALILEAELRTLRESGSRVELITPDPASVKAFGLNLMDARRSPGAAQAGLDQGRADSHRLRSVWGQG
jgi:NTE family protein